jgi:CHAD domain-containing protein
LAHRIGKSEKVGPALWRLLRDDIVGAREQLASGDGARVERVHRARQRLKRARSTLAVLKPVLGHHARDLKRSIAATARLLAGARDADVVAATARSLRETVGASDDAGLDRVVADLDRRAEEAHRHDTPVEEVVERLSLIETAIQGLSFKIEGEQLFERAFAAAYADGRRAMARARSSLSTPDLHAWRKEVKVLWHLVRLGRKRLPDSVRRTDDDVDRLGDVLGYDHDHAVLAERLALAPDADHSLMRQLSMIAKERQSLEKEAFMLGERIYRRKPRAFASEARLK